MDHLTSLSTEKLREALTRAEKEIGKGCELSLLIQGELARRQWRIGKFLDRHDAIYIAGTCLASVGAEQACGHAVGLIVAGAMIVSPLLLSALAAIAGSIFNQLATRDRDKRGEN